MTSSSSNGGVVTVKSVNENLVSTHSKPLPAPPLQAKKANSAAMGTLGNKNPPKVPVRARTKEENNGVEMLIQEHVMLQTQLSILARQRKELELEEQDLHNWADAEREKIDKKTAARNQEIDKKTAARNQEIDKKTAAKQNELRRIAIIEMLSLIFNAEQSAFAALSLEESNKFEFDAEKEIFSLPTPAITEVLVKFMKLNKRLISVDLTVCTHLPQESVIKLLQLAPSLGLKKLVLPRELSNEEKKFAILAKGSIKELQIVVE